MKIVVLGAGVIGVASAWYLARAGHEVHVLERQDAAGMETSFANGGQISVSHAEPWANPAAPARILAWLLRDDAPLRFRPRADPAQWRWGLAFLRECLPARARSNTGQLVRLGLHSRAMLQALRAETGIAYDHLARGILHFFTDAREFESARQDAREMRAHGIELKELTPRECAELEPALRSCESRLAGGTLSAEDESGDAHLFTQRLASLCGQRGVRFQYGTRIERIIAPAGAVDGVKAVRADGSPELVRGDAYVLALGSYSPQLAGPLGLRLPVYPAKGYSVTLPVLAPEAAYTVSLSDSEHKLVFTRLGERLRIAGTAELAGYDTTVDEKRCKAILRRTMELFPRAGDASRAQFWAGLRPATPGNVPCIGATRIRGLYLNTGHGTLGWTLACGSAQALADIIDGRAPAIDFAFGGG